MCEKVGLYRIDGFSTFRIPGQNTYGPSITLDGDVVEAIVKKVGKRDQYSRFFERLSNYLSNATKNTLARLDYFEDTCFLEGIVVGGNCACFSIGESIHSIRSGSFGNVKYCTHNIDHSEQSTILVVTWLMWFNAIIEETDFQLPYKM